MYVKKKNRSFVILNCCSIYLVSQADLDRIETTFREYTKGTNELDCASFKREIFANFLPEKLAQVDYSSKLLKYSKIFI